MVLGTSILRAATGAACQPPHYTYSIDEFGPKVAGVALNAPLLLNIGEHSNEEDIEQELDPVIELTAEGSDAKVVLSPTYLVGNAGIVAFVPQAPLQPNTTYSATARLDAKVTEPSASVLASWQLTTGTETQPSLELDGDLKVTFEEGIDAVFDCESELGSCGPECIEVSKVKVTKARITLPSVLGGFAEQYVAGSVSIYPTASSGDDGTLKIEHVPGLKAGEPGELLVTMPLVDGKAYRPCFSFEVSDARHDSIRSTPVCLDEAFPEPTEEMEEPKPEPEPEENDLPNDMVGPNDPPGENASDSELAADNERAPRRTSAGCSTSGGSHGFGSTLGLLLGLLAFSRRRPLKTAP